jgi:hypothetical protein
MRQQKRLVGVDAAVTHVSVPPGVEVVCILADLFSGRCYDIVNLFYGEGWKLRHKAH